MTKTRSARTLLLASAALLTLGLTACQTTGTTSGSMKSSDPVDVALARAADRAAAQNQRVDSLASIEQLFKKNSTDPALAVRYSRALREAGRLTRAAMVLTPFTTGKHKKNEAIITEFASVQAASGKYPEAEEYARIAVMINPDSAQAYHLLGIALDAQGQHKPAEVAFRKALDNWTGNPTPVLNNLGLNLAAQGFVDEALSTLRRAASLSPDRGEVERNIRIVQALQAQAGTSVPVHSTMNAKPAATETKKSEPVKTVKEEAIKEAAKEETKEAKKEPVKAPVKKTETAKKEPVKAAPKAETPKTEAAKTKETPAKKTETAKKEPVKAEKATAAPVEKITVENLSEKDKGTGKEAAATKPAAGDAEKPRPVVKPTLNQ